MARKKREPGKYWTPAIQKTKEKLDAERVLKEVKDRLIDKIPVIVKRDNKTVWLKHV